MSDWECPSERFLDSVDLGGFREYAQTHSDDAYVMGAPSTSSNAGKIRVCRGTLGKFGWLAPVSRPDICARLAQPAARVNSLQGCGIYRIDAL